LYLLIIKDIATTGPLAEKMFIPVKLLEQSLVSGCGHPGIVTMVEAAQKITGLPAYAVVGGLYLYYTQPEAGYWGNIFGAAKCTAGP